MRIRPPVQTHKSRSCPYLFAPGGWKLAAEQLPPPLNRWDYVMLVKDHATLEVEIANGEPSRLLIEIVLRQPLVGATAVYDSAEIERAIRDGFREIAAQVEIQQLTKAVRSPKLRVRRWAGRIGAFTFCAAIGSAATGLLSVSHLPRSYAVESLIPPGSGEPPPSTEAPSPGSQSRGAPQAPAVAPSGSLAGPATFGLHTQ
jgi:hypothetical protein